MAVSTQSLKGISKVEAVPSLASSSIIPRLKTSIEGSISMRAAVAYWTVQGSLISDKLVSLLASQSSFLCVDFHLPTNISELCALKKTGANVYLHLVKLPRRAVPSEIGMPSHLLHTKILLFDMQDETSELWVGSHNWTPRALEGVNIEYSLILRVQSDSPIYQETVKYLENIRRKLCQPVNPTLEMYYLSLQGQNEDTALTMELEGQNASNLDNERITIFGTDPDELIQVNRVGRQIYIAVDDSLTSKKFVYPGNILQTGLLTGSNAAAGGISFSPRRYAFRRGKTFPELKMPGVPPTAVVDAAHYFITIFLRPKVSVQLLEPPAKELWVTSTESALMERLDERAKRLFKKQPYFYVPSVKEGALPRPLMLEEKRLLKEYPLIMKKIVRPLDESG